MKKVFFSLILPVYNEDTIFESSVKKILTVLNKQRKPWEIIFVEDKSSDGSRETLKKILPATKNARAIFHSRNLGRGRTVTDGIKSAKGEICGYIDVDLEVAPTYIPLFIKEIEKGADVAVGKRHYEKNLKSVSRVLASRAYSFIVKMWLGLPISDTEAGYKFFRRNKILPVLEKVQNKGWFWDTEICARAFWSGLTTTQVPVLFVRRTDKKSTVRLIPDTWDYLVNIANFKSQIPKNQRQFAHAN